MTTAILRNATMVGDSIECTVEVTIDGLPTVVRNYTFRSADALAPENINPLINTEIIRMQSLQQACNLLDSLVGQNLASGVNPPLLIKPIPTSVIRNIDMVSWQVSYQGNNFNAITKIYDFYTSTDITLDNISKEPIAEATRLSELMQAANAVQSYIGQNLVAVASGSGY